MEKILLYPIGSLSSCRYATELLQLNGFSLTDHPSPEITHLLLDIPSFDTNGLLWDGSDLKKLLRMLPKDIRVIGGNIRQPFLEEYQKIDLLKDPYYLAKNAAITSECALKAAAPHLNRTFSDSSVLILGWGRIGKCLARLLRGYGATVTVAARKANDRAMLEALGYRSVDYSQLSSVLPQCSILFNTVPNLPLHNDILDTWKDGTAFDLASYPGMQGDSVIPARGLPGKYAPKTTGKLIFDTILRYYKEGTL